MTHWIWNAKDYHRHSETQMSQATELIGKLGIRGDERVLDIGCGDGKVTAQLARLVPEGAVLGLDASEEMVRFAQSHFPPSEFPNLSFHCGDARELTFYGQFEVVFSNATLHWVIDHRPVLAGISRSLRTGGRAVLRMGGKGNAASVVRAAESIMSTTRWAGFFAGFEFPCGHHGADEYREWLVQAGLTPVRVELIPTDMVKPDVASMSGWIRTTWMPYTHRVPKEMREEFIAELVSEYLAAHPPGADGSIHVGMAHLDVEAIKAGA